MVGFGFAAALAMTAMAAPGVSPSVFGKVFRAQRPSLVRVTSPFGIATGFLIGARGEVVFGTRSAPADGVGVTIMTEDGTSHEGFVVGYEPSLHLALAQMAAAPTDPLPPLRVGTDVGLERRRWVVVMTHSAKKGEPEPFAGTVEGGAAATQSRKAELRRYSVARVDAPGNLGSPVLDTQGKLVGVVVVPGRRRTEVVAVSEVIKFLKAAWR